MNNSRFTPGLVSVITPVYNAGRFLRECIDSVLNQTYKNVEIILVDDCSKDNSREIVESYDDPRVVYYLQEKNMGAGVARNKALELAKGQYVAFLDSDDVFSKTKIEEQIQRIQEKKCVMTYTGASLIDEDSKPLGKERKVKEKFSYKKLLKNTMLITSSILIDRELSGDFRMSEIRSGQDYATWLMILRDKGTIYGISKPLCQYRIVNNSLSSNKGKSVKQVYTIQRTQEHKCRLVAAYNTCWFIFHAVWKRIF